jgi:hypothetical protein
MTEQPRASGDNIVRLPARLRGITAAGLRPAVPGSPEDPRTQEALRLVESFLAIEDASARETLIALAESLVTHDWLRRTRQR